MTLHAHDQLHEPVVGLKCIQVSVPKSHANNRTNMLRIRLQGKHDNHAAARMIDTQQVPHTVMARFWSRRRRALVQAQQCGNVTVCGSCCKQPRLET